MVLKEHFEQRPIAATFGSFRSLMPLRTPSGPQWTESELETELLEQLAFSPLVFDLLTQPIINYELDGKRRRYTPDIAVQLHAVGDELASRYIIEVKRKEDLDREPENHAIRFKVGRLCAEDVGATFRVLDEAMIRTTYLQNARLLGRHLATPMGETEEDAADELTRHGPITVTQAISILAAHGFGEPDARYVIEQAAARRILDWDAGSRFTDETLLQAHPDGFLAAAEKDPILRILQSAPDA